MINDDGEKTSESGTPTRATSVEPEIETAHLLSSLRREELKAFKGLNALTALDPPVEALDRSNSPTVALPQYSDRGAVGVDEHGAVAVGNPPSTSTSSIPQQSEAGSFVFEEGEWEIRRIVSKRRIGGVYEYKVRWKDTWLSESEMENAQDLLRDFKAQSRARGGQNYGKPACTNKTR